LKSSGPRRTKAQKKEQQIIGKMPSEDAATPDIHPMKSRVFFALFCG
jgi:hypothetical protein